MKTQTAFYGVKIKVGDIMTIYLGESDELGDVKAKISGIGDDDTLHFVSIGDSKKFTGSTKGFTGSTKITGTDR